MPAPVRPAPFWTGAVGALRWPICREPSSHVTVLPAKKREKRPERVLVQLFQSSSPGRRALSRALPIGRHTLTPTPPPSCSAPRPRCQRRPQPLSQPESPVPPPCWEDDTRVRQQKAGVGAAE
ncbi:hypothetical protein NDU88_002705 [Pleurodeles waltl]|uniref:Uncharacterized protein n=1 Tax=Pleurodeles waltl TaxID=8319 RepID=A0AAV7RES2_PLEWA|nr:hypothetical protein NDU88_002705 [Pleurodeles waltl]